MDTDHSEQLRDAVQEAYERRRTLCVEGGGSKAFYGCEPRGLPLSIRSHRGIIRYQPAELVLTARAGTPLDEIECLLAEHRQMLPFEPPHFGPRATLGGALACGLSGPRRPYSGALRDFVLGVRCLTGRGEILRFGGEVIKNVAGFDVSRLMSGTLGTLGILLEASLKILPAPEQEATIALECRPAEAIHRMNLWGGQPLPVSATSHDGERLCVRLSGTSSGIRAARRIIGGELLQQCPAFWEDLREQRLAFFQGAEPLWRLGLPPATPPLAIAGQWFMEWGGGQRWLKTALPCADIRDSAARAGGHATLFRGGERNGMVFHPLSPALLAVHKRLKAAFDPHGILNPGRLYPGLEAPDCQNHANPAV